MVILRYVLLCGLLLLSVISLGCENNNSSLQKKIADLEAKVQSHKIQLDKDSYALVDTAQGYYSIVRTKYGSFAVVCRNVTPYLDGYKAQIDIGNLTSARFNGAKIGLEWGGSYSKVISATDTFYPGRATRVEVVLTPAKPEEIKLFRVKLEFDQMTLF